MKSTKSRVLAFALAGFAALMLMFGVFPTALADGESDTQPEDNGVQAEGPEWQNPFVDVKESDWFFDDVEYAVANGLFNGTSADTFSPGMPMTRGMLVTALGRIHGIDPADYSNNIFSDVDAGQYYAPYIAWAQESGIVTGRGLSLGSGEPMPYFAPDSPVTREEVAVILDRYIVFADYLFAVTLEYRIYTDEADIADYAKNAMQTMDKLGIVKGTGDGIMNPKGTATRAEVAAMLHRLAEKIKTR